MAAIDTSSVRKGVSEVTLQVLIEIRDIVRQYLIEELPLFDPASDDYASLADQGLDSMAILGLLMFLEERFDIIIADDDVRRRNFDSIKGLVLFVSKKLEDGRADENATAVQ